MPDHEVKAGTTAKLGRIEGELKVGRNARIIPESGGKVVVTGEASFEGPAIIECDFECQSLRVRGRGYGPGGDLTVKSDLTVHGRADIDASATVGGKIVTDDLDVGGHLRSGSVTSKRVRVGGHANVNGALRAESVDIGGHLKVSGEVELVDLRVGGHAEIEGGSITGEIKVRGHLKPTKKIDFGEAEIFGSLSLPAGSSGRRLSALGTVRFDGDGSCKELKVNGTTRVRGDFAAENIEVKGRFHSSGGARVSEKLRVYGTAEAGRAFECGSLGVLGKLVAERVSVAGHADIAGEVNTKAGLKANSILVGRGSKVAGPLVGAEVEVGREMDFGSLWGLPWWRGATGRPTSVEEVHGQTVTIGQRSSAKRVFGEVVELREGSMVQQVTYTKELKLPNKCFLHDPPVRVERLPDPPL